MLALQNDLFNDVELEASNELMAARGTGTGTSTTCPEGTAESEVEAESDGQVVVIAGVGCDNRQQIAGGATGVY